MVFLTALLAAGLVAGYGELRRQAPQPVPAAIASTAGANAALVKGGVVSDVYEGVISAKGKTYPADSGRSIRDMLQIAAAINPSNSGGPLLNPQGKVVGIDAAGALETM